MSEGERLVFFRVMKLYFSTDEVAEHLEIPKTTLEYYLLEFKMKINKVGKNRKFSHKDLETLQKIVDLTHKNGYTLEGVKEQLKIKRAKSNQNQEVVDRLLEIRKSLVFLRNGIE